MQVLFAAQLLDLWERGRYTSSSERALLLLSAAEPDLALEQLGSWSIGRRDTALLTLRTLTFGDLLSGLAGCPQCGEQIEMDFTVSDILLSPSTATSTELTLAMDGYRVVFRLPNSFDLAALDQESDGLAEEGKLLQGCVLEAYKGDAACPAADLPADVVAAISNQMAEADPQAEIELALICPTCGSQWQVLFDIVTFFWKEIDAWAVRTLHDVHVLASAYGWREADILALSPWRRQFYMDLISA